MKNWWKTILQMALPLVRAAGQAKRDEDENNTGTDDLIGYSLIYLADLGAAIISGDAAKIKDALNKTAPKSF